MTETVATGPRGSDLSAAIPSGEAVILQNDSLRVALWPKQGGKVVSIVARTKAGELELLHPPLHPYGAASGSSGFEFSDAGGWDECLPSVAACTIHGVQVPDHGDVWRKAWTASTADSEVSAWVDASSLPLKLSKRLFLERSSLRTEYTVENTGAQSTEFLWSAHPLFQVEEGDHILLPGSVADVRVEGSTIDTLARADGHCAWPMAETAEGTWIDLSRVGPRDGTTAYKLFAGRLAAGWCGLYRSKQQLGILMQFDPALTPYAGLWISHAQWPAGGAHRQYTVALEPTTAPCDALDRASAMGASIILAPGASIAWPLRLSIIASVSYDNFLAEANASADVSTAGN